jgi:hypothetical protein
MNTGKPPRAYARILALLCVGVLIGILGAAWWPFHAPLNQVRWIEGANGIEFGGRGIVASAASFQPASRQGDCTIELWIEPATTEKSGTALAFDSFPDARYPFSLRQFAGNIAVQRTRYDEHGELDRRWFQTNGVFERGKPVLLTLTGDSSKTAIYANGAALSHSTDFGFNSADLAGRIVLGNSTTRDTWQGRVLGLVIYNVALTPGEVEQHYREWMQGRPASPAGAISPAALYRFDEQQGTEIRSQAGAGPELRIAARFFELRPPFLDPPWKLFSSPWNGWRTWSYWSDVLLNIAGFVPFGFLFTAYFAFALQSSRPRLSAALFGFALSLTIECVQYWLPTRSSSLTDVITNTAGSALGAWLFFPALAARLHAVMKRNAQSQNKLSALAADQGRVIRTRS